VRGEIRKEKSADSHICSDSRSFKASLVVALVSACAALFVGYYNFAISGVFNSAFPGTDTPHYARWLSNMTGSGIAGALGYATGNDRFLFWFLVSFGCGVLWWI